MRGLRQVVWTAALATTLAGCATYYPDASGYTEGYASNLFYCPANPYAGFGCPGGFYYNDRFFPDAYAFFSFYHIDRRHWRDFHERYYWSWDDGVRAGPAAAGRQPGDPIVWSGHFPHAGRGLMRGHAFKSGIGGAHAFFRHG